MAGLGYGGMLTPHPHTINAHRNTGKQEHFSEVISTGIASLKANGLHEQFPVSCVLAVIQQDFTHYISVSFFLSFVLCLQFGALLRLY